jgi:hypothetical protein
MIDLDRHPALTTDPDRFVQRLQELIRLGSHVRDVHAAIGRHRAGCLDQLVRPCEGRRRVDQRRRDAERTAFHRPAHDLAHAVELRGIRRA